MATITTRDGTEIFYKDWGAGPPVVFSHGWPLNADAWDDQAYFVASQGYRAIAHDRRGHGRSSQSWNGNDMDTYADDLAQVIDALDLHDAVLVGHSTGGGEVARYLGRHGTSRVVKAVLVGAVPPLMLKTDANPGGQPIEAFDALREGVLKDRSQFYRDLSAPFYGANRPGSDISQGLRDWFWALSIQVGLKGAYDCIKAFSETDFTGDLKKIDIPVLIIQGDDDQIVPLDDSGRRSVQILKDASLKVYPGAPHGLANTAAYKNTLNADLLAFLRG
ncbi:MAG: alpha/beta fold hydrolase [Streptosporangiaceae bacterium]